MRHAARPKVLGVDPRLVLVVELGAAVDPEEFSRAGLRLLDTSDRSFVVAFADDPQLAGFMARLDACAAGVPVDQRAEPYAGFVDAIDGVRLIGPDDRISPALASMVASAEPATELRLDIELWHPDNRDLAVEWLDALRSAVAAASGRVVDAHVNDRAGVILARVYLSAGRIREIAELDTIALLDVLPTPALTIPQLYASTPDQLPDVRPPDQRAAIVGIIDSGVASGHPLIGPAVLAAEALSPAIADGEDRSGHGTMVAGLLLHGPLERVLGRTLPLRPLCRLVSVAVLDTNNSFPDADLWERDLVEAIEWCAAQGASIINLSLGDARRPFRPPRQQAAAALIDDLARRLNLVIVVAAGNSHPRDYLAAVTEDTVADYPAALLDDTRTGVIDPGTAALVLTVGGVTDAAAATGYSARETVLRRPFGEPGWPSPITRCGPGVGQAIKPELVERAGTLGYESGRLVDNDPELNVISTRLSTGRLLGHGLGTSFAAPLVTRVASAVKARHPAFSANQVRALVLVSAQSADFEAQLEGATVAVRRDAARRLLGYGRPSIARAIESTRHRVLLVAEDSIPVNGIHIYELPVPRSFLDSGGRRGIDVALAYDPRTRLARLDYLATKMEFHLIRGMPLADVIDVVAKVEGDDEVDLEGDDDGVATGDEAARRPPTLSKLGSRVVKFQPVNRVRSRGTNQMGRVEFATRWTEDQHSPLYLVVRNVNRWDDDTATQAYALAIALWRTTDQAELYVDLEAQLEAVVELPVEVELEV